MPAVTTGNVLWDWYDRDMLKLTFSGSFAISATISTMKLPTATVNSQPACSTAFMLLGALKTHKKRERKWNKTKNLEDGCELFKGWRSSSYLWVGKLQTSNRKHHFTSSDEEVLWDLQSHWGRVGLYVFYLSNGLVTLIERSRNNKAWCNSKENFKKKKKCQCILYFSHNQTDKIQDI